ncbi:hypothetical protein Acr_04g0004470 [Actinidia rufa]|uniref:Uncharacterized protein n=1 Tax=Actinidia rufa TaxID=165716 RepID=A0A7J0EIH8_9ERIC|nr:hypothetical protein Acr_04g0004470 [Actinidia rufa]
MSCKFRFAARHPLGLPSTSVSRPSLGATLSVDCLILSLSSHDTTKDHETCVTLGNAMMLPHDVADHAVESSMEFGGKLVMLGAQLFQRAVSTSLRLKQATMDLKKATQKANSLKKELKQAKTELVDARLGIPCPPIQQPASPGRYSPIVLPDFDEKEYATQLVDEGGANTVVAEVRTGIIETVVKGAEGGSAGEAKGENLV